MNGQVEGFGLVLGGLLFMGYIGVSGVFGSWDAYMYAY